MTSYLLNEKYLIKLDDLLKQMAPTPLFNDVHKNHYGTIRPIRCRPGTKIKRELIDPDNPGLGYRYYTEAYFVQDFEKDSEEKGPFKIYAAANFPNMDKYDEITMTTTPAWAIYRGRWEVFIWIYLDEKQAFVKNVQAATYFVDETGYETAAEVQAAMDAIDAQIAALNQTITTNNLPVQICVFKPWTKFLINVECENNDIKGTYKWEKQILIKEFGFVQEINPEDDENAKDKRDCNIDLNNVLHGTKIASGS